MNHSSTVLVTDHGNHPASKWAMAAAERIVNDLHANDPLAEAKAVVKIADVLERHHDNARVTLHQSLALDAAAILSEIDLSTVAAIVTEIIAAMQDSQWAEHFANGVAYLTEIVGTFLAAQHHTDKLWHADRNPSCPHAAAYAAQHRGV